MRSIRIPPSKSITHRALFCGAFADGISFLYNPLTCEDTQATIEALRALGIKIKTDSSVWMIHGRPLQQPLQKIDCSESGTTYRFLDAINHILKLNISLTGKEGLLKRPLQNHIQKNGETILVNGKLSSQTLSGLLLAAPLSTKKVKINLTGELTSRPYVEMTCAIQKKFGIQVEKESSTTYSTHPQKYTPRPFAVEGDWSHAAFWIVAGMIHHPLTLQNIQLSGLQGDEKICEIAKKCGGILEWKNENLIVTPSENLKPLTVDCKDIPDLFPILCVLATHIAGRSHFKNVGRLIHKESNRVAAMQETLASFCIPCGMQEETFWIEGNQAQKIKHLQTPILQISQDHRIVMATAILDWNRQYFQYQHPASVSKSYPQFWNDFRNILQ